MMADRNSQVPVGIIGAMSMEVESIIGEMTVEEKIVISGLEFYKGMYAGVSCVVVKCGVGKVNAAVCAQTVILNFAPKLIINTGVAGGLGNVRIGDLVVSSACVQHDFDTTVFGDKLGTLSIGSEEMIQIPCNEKAAGILLEEAEAVYGNAHTGVIATGDCFIASAERCRFLEKQFSAKACEMEGGSIAHVCYMNKTAVVILRAISDNANEEGTVDFEAFVREAAEKSQKLLKAALPKLCEFIKEI